MKNAHWIIASALLLFCSQQAIPSSMTQMDEVVKAIFAARLFEQTTISPDGQRVAWVEMMVGSSAIYVTDVTSDGKKVRIRAGKRDSHESEIAWSKDSQQIAFLSDAHKAGDMQLYVTDAAGGPFKKLTNVSGALTKPTWSQDGKTIAILFTENASGKLGPLAAHPPETGEIQEVVFEQRLALVDVSTGTVTQISPADMYIYEYDWSPNGKQFVVTAAQGNGDKNWWIAQLYTVDMESRSMKSIYKPSLQITNPVWSPDGRLIAFLEGLLSDEVLVGCDIFTINEQGKELKNQTPGMKASASWIAWEPDGKKIIFAEFVNGDSGIATVEISNENVETLWRGAEKITSNEFWTNTLSISRDGKSMAIIRQSFSAPPEVWAGTIGNWKQVTKINNGLTQLWGDAKSIQWESDGYNVQGWLLYPKNFDQSKKYPMVVDIHGGPGWAWSSVWPQEHNYFAGLSALGYFVFYPNPRGSFGQGEKFVRANVKDFGYGDFQDIMRGVDEAIRVAPIDANRLGIAGWSYGGFMTMWAVTQTSRFKAAIAGAGISNWQSYYGQNMIDQWLIPFFGASVYDDPEVYAKSSPINFIKNVKTPTLILVGDSDAECPTPQSWEYWRALRRLDVPSTLVVYEHEGHLFESSENQRDLIVRTYEWFEKYLINPPSE